ncbi:MAG: hypothetical protein Q9159_000392 [Coniocarpon cinnabarinum]
MRDDLDGRTLVFSISYDPYQVALYSHFAICGDATLTKELHYYRRIIRSLDLEEENGSGHLISYNFVCNVYEGFAPRHLSRIREAVAVLAQSSEAGAGDVNSQDQSDADSSDGGRKRVRTEVSQLIEQLAQQREDSTKQMSQLMEQLAQQREELAQQREDSAKQLAQQREDSTKQMSQLIEQLAQQREDSAKQYGTTHVCTATAKLPEPRRGVWLATQGVSLHRDGR